MRPSRGADPGLRKVAAIAAVAAVLNVGVTACAKNIAETSDAGAGEEQAVTVELARVTREDVVAWVDVAGALVPMPGRDVKLGALTAGRVAEVAVAEGDPVKKGAPLLRLEQQPLRDAVAQAEAAYVQAKAQRLLAETKLRSAEQAFDAGVAARAEVDDARAAEVAARSAERSTEAALSTAQNALARSELRAPFDGYVAAVSVAAGEPVDASGKALVEVVDNVSLELRAGVPSDLALRIRPGMSAEINVQGLTAGPVPGTVIAVSPTLDPATGLGTVRIRIENPSGQLKAGAQARARIAVEVYRGVLTIPRSAVVPMRQGEAAPAEEDDGGYTGPAVEWVDAEGHVHRRRVQLGVTSGDRIEVRSGLSEGDVVVVSGAYALPDGTAVRSNASKVSP